MTSAPFPPAVYNFVVIAFFAFLGCLFFMSWYLKTNSSRLGELPARSFIWIETVFRFRDFTRAHFSKIHAVYHLTVFLLFFITSTVCGSIVLHGLTLPAPVNIGVVIVGGAIFVILVALFVHLGRKGYYTREQVETEKDMNQ